MAPFAGFNMPLRYSSEKEEHLAVRENVGVFDVSHMGEFILNGPYALDLIQWISSNDASRLVDGQAQYSYLPNDKGGIVDDLLIYRISHQEYMMVVNAANIEKDWKWIKSHDKRGVEMKNISEATVLLAIQGPKALTTLQKLTAVNLSEMKFYTFLEEELAGKEMIISATGYTGAGGFELYIKKEDAEDVWHEIFDAGEEFGIKPVGLGARDTLRLEKGYCLYGNDIDDTTSPIEAGLGRVTNFKKDFVNARNLRSQKTKGVRQKLVGFQMEDNGIPRQGYRIVNASGDVIGRVTSGTMSPSLKRGIGMGYVINGYNSVNSKIYVEIRKKHLESRVVKLPFLQSVKR